MIRKVDFADDLLPRLEAEAARLKTSLSGLVNMLLCGPAAAPFQAVPGPAPAPTRPESGPGEGVGGGASLSLWEGEEEEQEGKPRRKTKERAPKVPPPLPDVPADLDTPEWQGTVTLWLKYKRERGQSYQPTGLEALFSMLRRAGPRVGAPSIIRSAGNRWQGIKLLEERELVDVLPFAPPDPELAWRVEEVWASRVYAYREYQRQNVGVVPSVDPVLTPALRGLIEQALRTFDEHLLGPTDRAHWRYGSITRAAGIGHFYSAWHIGEDPKAPGMKQLGHDLPWRNGNTQRFADLYFETRDLSEAAERARR